MKKIFIICLLIVICMSSVQTAENEDILGKILTEAGFSRADLGYQPKGYWNRFPLDIPYRLTSFDALYAEPLKLIDYATVMGNTVEQYLDPTYADTNANALYYLVYNLGVDKKLGGFRSYSANLLDAPNSPTPIITAIEDLYKMADRETIFQSFGSTTHPFVNDSIQAELNKLPDSAKIHIAKIIVNLGDAIKWRNIAFRNCDASDMQKVIAIRDLADTQNDGTKYYPEIDDIASSIDYPSLHYSALKVAAAVGEAEANLKQYVKDIPDDFELHIETPYGNIAFLSPVFKKHKLPQPKATAGTVAPIKGWYEIEATNYLLILDFGRNIIYQGSAGATASLANPVSVVLDMGGNDYYGFQRDSYPQTTGVGILGVGLVFDSDGNDEYNGTDFAQGTGLFGVGVLYDKKGNDKYKASLSAQGCGYFGIGLCLDGTGDDEYYIHGSGQGCGGVGGGIGVCASFDGKDRYTAEPFSEIFNRGDYHSEHTINGNEAQGAGFGRRGDGSDGHSWAGGLGAIVDIHGDDFYYSGNWSLGVGYWFGTGIAVDRNGDDTYKSCYFTQGSGAHFCNGILLDENGNDKHELYETAGAALGFGWDFANSLLINKNGDDVYRAKIISMGLAQIRSFAFLIDVGGNDSYYLGEGTDGLGEASYRDYYKTPSKLTPYYFYGKSFGGFIDIGGNDFYYDFKDDKQTASSLFKNNSLWFQPSKTDSTYGGNSFGVGIDVESGVIPELEIWER